MQATIHLVSLLFCYAQTTYSLTDPSPEDCDKYCFKDCSQYLHTPGIEDELEDSRRIWVPSLGMGIFYKARDTVQFSNCITVNRLCNCEYKINKSNPLLWLAISGFAVIAALVLYCTCMRFEIYRFGKLCCSKNPSSQPVVIIPTVSIISNNSNNDASFSDWHTEKDYDDTQAPPEYIPPPSYYDTVSRKMFNENNNNETEEEVVDKDKINSNLS